MSAFKDAVPVFGIAVGFGMLVAGIHLADAISKLDHTYTTEGHCQTVICGDDLHNQGADVPKITPPRPVEIRPM